MNRATEHTLEFLLEFDGRRHWYEGGYFSNFEIRRVEVTLEKPHGLKYSFTLHAPDGARLVGFDNAHSVAPTGASFRKRPAASDHWHRTAADPGRPYVYKSAEQLLVDYFDEIERTLKERNVPIEVIATDGRK